MRFFLLGIPISLAGAFLGSVVGMLFGLMLVAVLAILMGEMSRIGDLSGFISVVFITLALLGAVTGAIAGWWLILRAPEEWIGHRHDTRVCAKCGYDLTANQSGTCPECGKEIPWRQRRYVATYKS
ncbi:MAG: hypothetical protein ACE37H_10655 [Phycisphaeraceae bacterium]